MIRETVWIVYQPQDYQRAHVLGAFRNRGDAQRMQNAENRRMQPDGNRESAVTITEVPLE